MRRCASQIWDPSPKSSTDYYCTGAFAKSTSEKQSRLEYSDLGIKNAKILVVEDELRIPSSPDFDLVLTELMMRDNTGFTRLDHVCVNCPDIRRRPRCILSWHWQCPPIGSDERPGQLRFKGTSGEAYKKALKPAMLQLFQ
jgi:hypothetical protein